MAKSNKCSTARKGEPIWVKATKTHLHTVGGYKYEADLSDEECLTRLAWERGYDIEKIDTKRCRVMIRFPKV
jgi:hypothetical protein